MTEDKRPKKENYMTCPACTTEADDPVMYHKTALESVNDDMFGEEPYFMCPKGHRIPVKAREPAAT